MQSYPGQCTYRNGHLACTSISWLWSVACSSKLLVNPMASHDQIKLIMQNGITLHEMITSKYNCQMIHSFELIQTHSPKNFQINEIVVLHDANLYNEFKSDNVFLSSNIKLLDGQSLVLTLNNHTIAFYQHTKKVSFVFDPMVATIRQIESVSAYIDSLPLPSRAFNQSYGVLLNPLPEASSC